MRKFPGEVNPAERSQPSRATMNSRMMMETSLPDRAANVPAGGIRLPYSGNHNGGDQHQQDKDECDDETKGKRILR